MPDNEIVITYHTNAQKESETNYINGKYMEFINIGMKTDRNILKQIILVENWTLSKLV